MSMDVEQREAKGDGQSAALTWAEFDRLLETMKAELRSETATTAGGGEDDAQFLPASDDDRNYDVSEGAAERVAGHDVAADAPVEDVEDLEQEALPAFLTVQYGQSWSERAVEGSLASAIGGRRPATERAALTRTLAAAGATVLVAVAAASTSMAYLTSWPNDGVATTVQLKHDGYVASASLLNVEALFIKAALGEADAVAEPPGAQVTLVRADQRGIAFDGPPQAEANLRVATAADAPRLHRPAAVDGDRQGVHDKQPEALTVKLDGATLDIVIERGQSLLKSGDIASARLLFEKVYEAGDPRGARYMAMSYDPAYFSEYPVAGLVPDRNLANVWYERAGVLPPIEKAGAGLEVAQQ